jgi:hypothetical protein
MKCSIQIICVHNIFYFLLIKVLFSSQDCSYHGAVVLLFYFDIKYYDIMCYLYVYICLWMYWITQHCDYDVHVLNYALSNKWFEFEFELKVVISLRWNIRFSVLFAVDIFYKLY